jgi:hypothetical protein
MGLTIKVFLLGLIMGLTIKVFLLDGVGGQDCKVPHSLPRIFHLFKLFGCWSKVQILFIGQP